MFARLLARMKRSTLAKGVVVLAGGSMLTQGILALLTPVVTRLYTPADFGLSGYLMTILSIVLLVSNLRYEQATVVQEDDEDAYNGVLFSIGLAVLFTLLVGVACLVVYFCVRGGTLYQLRPYLWLAPLLVLGGGIFQPLSSWALRRRLYRVIAQTRLSQSISSSAASIAIGLIWHGPLGLIVGGVFNQSAGIVSQARDMFRVRREKKLGVSWPRMRRFMSEFRQYPLYSSPAALLNTAGLMLPAILLTNAYGTTVTGHYNLALRILGLPMALVGAAVSKVFLAEASSAMRDHPELLRPLFRKSFRAMLQLSSAVVLVGLVSPFVFAPVFGEAWREAGFYTLLLSLFSAAKLVVSPTSTIVIIAGKQDVQLILDAIRAVMVVLVLIGLPMLGYGPRLTLSVFTLGMTLLYVASEIVYMRMLDHLVPPPAPPAPPVEVELPVPVGG